jgi:hypothetical protein
MVTAVQKSLKLLTEVRQAHQQMEKDPQTTERLKIFYD